MTWDVKSVIKPKSAITTKSMGLTSWARGWCIAGADNLQQLDNMCMMSAVRGHTSLRSLCRNALWRIVTSQELWNSAALLHKLVTEYLFRKLCAGGCHSNWHQNTEQSAWSQHSAAVPWRLQQVSGPDHHRWWNVGCTHYPRTQAEVRALASQTKFKQTLSAQEVMCTVLWDRQGVLINFLTRGETVNAERYCESPRNCNGPLRTRGVGFLCLLFMVKFSVKFIL